MKRIQNKGFTLIELLVVISIIGLLSSVVLASLSQARIKARNSARMQQAHEIDLAIELYRSEHGYAPTLQGTCDFSRAQDGSGDLTQWNYKSCIADASSLNPSSVAAWENLKKDLAKYIPQLPTDPCGTNCPNGGYQYTSPAALKVYTCIVNPDLSETVCPTVTASTGALDYGSEAYAGGTPTRSNSGITTNSTGISGFFVPPSTNSSNS
jgi:prepilin-type N-terminal cleavage/methylation domain-containing protein